MKKPIAETIIPRPYPDQFNSIRLILPQSEKVGQSDQLLHHPTPTSTSLPQEGRRGRGEKRKKDVDQVDKQDWYTRVACQSGGRGNSRKSSLVRIE